LHIASAKQLRCQTESRKTTSAHCHQKTQQDNKHASLNKLSGNSIKQQIRLAQQAIN